MKKILIIICFLLFAVISNGQQNIRGNSLWSHTTITNDTSYVETGDEPKGAEFWDDKHRTVTITLGNGVNLQVGQEFLVHVYNATSDTLKDQRVVGFGGVSNSRISAVYASKDERHTFFGATTEDIAPSDSGLAVGLIGAIHNATTGSLVAGLPFYLDTMGYLTNERPAFPDYIYPLGTVLKEGIGDGVIYFRSDGVNFRASILEAFDGIIRETFDFRTYSDGVNTYGVLTNPNLENSDKLTQILSDGWADFSVPDTIQLVNGISGTKQMNYVYIPISNKQLTVSTSSYPADTVEFIKVATVGLYDAATTQTDGAIINQNINNHLKSDNGNGHMVHIGDKLRAFYAQWIRPGLSASLSGYPDSLFISVTSGKIRQLHPQSIPEMTMPNVRCYVLNDPDNGEYPTDNLNYISKYSDGSIWNNQWSKIVVLVVGNKSGEESHILVNLPRGGYLTEQDAIDDRKGYANYSIPYDYNGKTVLVSSHVIRIGATGITYNPSTGYEDLRGKIPNNTAGSSTGASGVTEYVQLDDTPSALEALAFQRADATGTALENVLAENIQLIEFNSTDFSLDQNQIVGLPDSLLSKQNNITLTTTGNSGASTFVGDVLNVPNYVDGLTGGYLPYLNSTFLDDSPVYTDGNGIIIDNYTRIYGAANNGALTNISDNYAIVLSGGASVSEGGNIKLNGGLSSDPNQISFRQGTSDVLVITPQMNLLLNKNDIYNNDATFQIGKDDIVDGVVFSIDNMATSGWSVVGEVLGRIDFTTNDGSTSEPIRGQIKVIDQSTSSAYPAFSTMVFSTTKFNTMSEVLRLTYESNVLIGTTTDNLVDNLQVNGTASFSPATLGSQGVIRSQLENASIDVDFNSIAINTVDINQIISDSTQTAKIDSVAYYNDTLNIVEGGISHKVEIPQMIDSYVNGSSFNTGTGVLTLTGTGSAGTSRDLDGRWGLLGSSNVWTGVYNRFDIAEILDRTDYYTGTSSLYSGTIRSTVYQTLEVNGSSRLNLYGDDRLMYLTTNGIYSDLDSAAATDYVQYYNKLTGEETYGVLPSGSGTVTGVSAGNGMDFTTITTTGDVTMGTPSSVTASSTNSTTSTSHTHALDITGVLWDGRVVTTNPTITNNDYVVVLDDASITEIYMPASSSDGQRFIFVNRTSTSINLRNSTDTADVPYYTLLGGSDTNTNTPINRVTCIQKISGNWYQIMAFN